MLSFPLSMRAVIVALSICALPLAAVSAAPTPAAGAIAAAPQAFAVRVEGQGPPVILIPGLMCDGRVWNRTVTHLKDHYQCHVLSLAGFAGVPPVQGEFVPTMREAIVRYIREKKLAKPIIVGHSLGGHLALAVAVEAPAEVGPLVIVDGGAALGPLMAPGVPADAWARQTAMIRDAMANMNQAAFEAQNHMMLSQMVTDPHTAEVLAKEAGKSDVKTVARATYELMTADLRNAVAAIQSPVLLIGSAPFAKDAAAQAGAKALYDDQIAKVPRHKVVMTYEARHFVMQDAPEFFYGELDHFLAEAK